MRYSLARAWFHVGEAPKPDVLRRTCERPSWMWQYGAGWSAHPGGARSPDADSSRIVSTPGAGIGRHLAEASASAMSCAPQQPQVGL